MWRYQGKIERVISAAVHTCEVPSVGQVRWVPGGHVSAFLLQQPAFRKAILDSLERLANPVQDRAEAHSAAKAA
jgi:hypothetical protein